jgi:hypothetical protein
LDQIFNSWTEEDCKGVNKEIELQLKEMVISRSKEEEGQVLPVIVAESTSGEKRAVVKFKD